MVYTPHVFLTVEALYRKEYYEAFDCVNGELESRFLSKNFLFVLNIETMLISSENGTMSPLHEAFKRTYANDIDMHKLFFATPVVT